MKEAIQESSQAGQAPVVQTKYGKLAGVKGSGPSWVWQGVPYARPPVGALRWRAPQPPEAWEGIRQSNGRFEMSAQLAMGRTWVPQDIITGSEDCLYLNIWRPQTTEENLPVYVYLHGGANNFGSALLYDGSAIASTSNMVVVIPQYRLGPMGWFNHPALKESVTAEEASGNFGMLDTLQALMWVRDNISAFGGDPGNVTLTGQSAGAHNTMNLVVSPLAKGLFRRVLCQSIGPDLSTVARGIKMADTTIENLLITDGRARGRAAASAVRKRMNGPETADYLRGKSAEQIIRAQLTNRGSLKFHPAYIDGTVIPADWQKAIRSGNYNRVPIILGNNANEMNSFLPLLGARIPTSNLRRWIDLHRVLDGHLRLKDVMPLNIDRNIYKLCGHLISTHFKAVHVDALARSLREKQDDVYCYFFKWGGPGSGPAPYDFIFGAAHAVDIAFFFGWPWDAFGYAFTEENKPGREALQEAMMGFAARFARTGDPNPAGGGTPGWERWSNAAGGSKCMVFDATFTEAKVGMDRREVTLPGGLLR